MAGKDIQILWGLVVFLFDEYLICILMMTAALWWRWMIQNLMWCCRNHITSAASKPTISQHQVADEQVSEWYHLPHLWMLLWPLCLPRFTILILCWCICSIMLPNTMYASLRKKQEHHFPGPKKHQWHSTQQLMDLSSNRQLHHKFQLTGHFTRWLWHPTGTWSQPATWMLCWCLLTMLIWSTPGTSPLF